MSDKQRRSLASAHATLMFLALAALMSLVLFRSGGPPKTAAWLADASIWVQAATLFFLASLALLELQLAQVLRSDSSTPDLSGLLGLPSLLGNLWVLLVASAVAWRGAASRTLLAGLDWHLAVLVACSLLAVVLLAVSQALAPKELPPRDRAADPLRWSGSCHAVVSLLTIFALWYLETRPLR